MRPVTSGARALLAVGLLAAVWAAPAWAAHGQSGSGATSGHAGMAQPPSTASARVSQRQGEGPRVGSHAMVLFGSDGLLYASHIPMFHSAVHNMQVLLVVSLAHPDLPASPDFSDGTYTFMPEKFDLNDLVAGRLKRFKATVFRGNLEDAQRRQELFRDATVQVEGVLHARQLDADAQAHSELRYFVLSTGCGVYLVHPLSRAPDFDQVVKVSLGRPVPRTGAALPVLRLEGRGNAAGERLKSGERLSAKREDGEAVTLTVERELSFLPGPDFVPGAP